MMHELNHPEVCMAILASHGRRITMPDSEIGKADTITCRLIDTQVVPILPHITVLELVEKLLNGDLVITQKCLQTNKIGISTW